MSTVGVLEIQLMANMARLSEDMKRAERVVGDSMTKVEKSVRSAHDVMQKLGMGIGVMAALEAVKQLSDRYTKLDAQLRLSTKTQLEYNTALTDVRRISTTAQADIGATTMLYTRMLNVMQGTTVTQKQLATVTESVSYGLKAYGATAAEASSASLQLSQAMGANRLGGEEFRAVMEAMPNVMKVLATSMGVPLGELRALSIAGKITAAEMVKAWSDPAVAESFRQAALLSRTISGELVVMGNNTMQFVGALMKATGATDGAITAISALGDVFKFLLTYVKEVTSLVLTLAAFYGGKYVIGMVQARIATMAVNAELARNAIVNTEAALAAQFGAKAALVQASQVALVTGNTKLATAARIEYITATKAVAVAEAAQAAATLTWMGKLRAFAAANMLGLIGMALWGIYAIADQLGWIDKLSNKLGDFFNTQESHIRRLKDLAGGGVAGDAMGRAIENEAKRAAAIASSQARIDAMQSMGVTGDVTTVHGTSAMIAKLQSDIAKWSAGGTSRNDDRMIANAERAIRILTDYQAELGKAVSAVSLVDVQRTGEWSKMLETTYTSAQKQAARLLDLRKMYEAHLEKLSGATVLADRLKLTKEYEAGKAAIIAEFAKKKEKKEAADPYSWRIAMFERLTAESQATGKQLTNIEAVAAEEAKAHDKVTKAIVTESELREVARAADTRAIVIAAGERVKDIEKTIAAVERERVVAVSTSRDMVKYDDALLVAEQDKLWYKIQSTDQLDAQLALLKEIDAIEKKRAILKKEAAFSDIFTSSKNQEDAYEKTAKGLITGTITEWRGMLQSLGDSFKTKVIDTLSKQVSTFVQDSLGSMGNMWVGIIMAAIAGSGVLNQWQKSSAAAVTTLTGGRGGVGGSVATLWERDQGWFKQKEVEWRVTGLTTKQSQAYNASLQSITEAFSTAGDMLGYANAGTQAFTVSLSTTGDITSGLANQIGSQLVPAIVLFQREGENLQQTAQRLTDTFRATGDLLVATGVSSQQAFGGMGLQSAAARDSLVAASGGLSAFTANSSAFISNFLTPAEKLAPAADAVARTFEKLGIVGVSTNDQFAQLVKEQLALGNTDVVAELLSVSGAFDSLTEAASTANAQIAALLDKKTFSSLVDYTRATMLGGSAASAIAAASVNIGDTLSAEQAATAAFEAANAAAIAAAAAENVPVLPDATVPDSLWSQIIQAIKYILDELWLMLRELIDSIWVGLRDLINGLWVAIRDGIAGIGGGFFGGGGGGGGGWDLIPWTPWAKGGAFNSAGTHAFANGSAFTNGLYSSPTPFMFANGDGFGNGVMGEAGPEAVMPLQRGSDGRLGVVANGGGSEVVSELRALREEVTQLRADNRAERGAMVGSMLRSERIIDKWDHIGMPQVQIA